jgi:hypothetical protein
VVELKNRNALLTTPIEELVPRFAELNLMGQAEASAQFALHALGETFLCSEILGRSLALEARSSKPAAPQCVHEEVFLHNWLADHGLVRHSGRTWSIPGGTPDAEEPLIRYLMTLRRIRSRRWLTDVAIEMSLSELAAQAPGRMRPNFNEYCLNVHGFASHNRARILAGVTMAPYVHWSWAEIEEFVTLIRSVGLSVRVGLAEDQWHTNQSMPFVIWNPRLVDLQRIDSRTAPGRFGVGN